MNVEFLQESRWDPSKIQSGGPFTIKDLVDSYYDWILGIGVYERQTVGDKLRNLRDKIFYPLNPLDRLYIASRLKEINQAKK